MAASFMNWAFNLNRPQIRKHWELIPDDTDFLITHAPPSGFSTWLGVRSISDAAIL